MMLNTTIDLGPHLERAPDLTDDCPDTIPRDQRVAKQTILDLFLPYLVRKGPLYLLDIGSAGGWCALRWASMFPATVQCTTLFEAEAKALRALLLQQPFVGIQENMPDGWSAAFHAVRASHVLEHSYAPCIAMKEYARVLKPGGVLQIVIPQATGYTRLTSERPHRLGSFPGHPFCASSETIIEMLRHVKLHFESYHEIPQKCDGVTHYYHRVWMATKEA